MADAEAVSGAFEGELHSRAPEPGLAGASGAGSSLPKPVEVKRAGTNPAPRPAPHRKQLVATPRAAYATAPACCVRLCVPPPQSAVQLKANAADELGKTARANQLVDSRDQLLSIPIDLANAPPDSPTEPRRDPPEAGGRHFFAR